MKDKRVGWLPFALTVTFSLGLLWSLVCAAKGCLTGLPWCGLSEGGAVVGFFGFGIPIVLAALSTTHIWHDHKDLLKVYGWASSILGCIFGICLFIVVGYETTANERISPAIIVFFLAFGTPMVLLGNSGLRALYPQEPPDCMGKN